MSEKQTINDLLMEVTKLRKDAEYLKGEVAYWKQQVQRNNSVANGCDAADWEDSCDTREELEHDCEWMAHAWAPDDFPDDKFEKKLYREIIEKLDRQAAITRAECEAELVVIDWWTDEHGNTHAIAANGEEVCHYVKGEHAEAVNKMIMELEAENAELREMLGHTTCEYVIEDNANESDVRFRCTKEVR